MFLNSSLRIRGSIVQDPSNSPPQAQANLECDGRQNFTSHLLRLSTGSGVVNVRVIVITLFKKQHLMRTSSINPDKASDYLLLCDVDFQGLRRKVF